MEVMYPIIIFISIILFIVCFFVSFKKKKSNNHKNKIANTYIIKNSKLYKSIIKKYKIGIYIVYSLIFIALLFSAILTSRLNETKVIENKIYNRDIILCMDVSSSVNDLNSELVKTYSEVVKSLKGERFGISIFNTSSYLLVPLTDDYDYLQEVLATLSKAFDVNDGNYTSTTEYFYLLRYIMNGTLIGNETRGSSLVGDGLASCVFDFPNLNEDRTRIIVLSTDNDVRGEEYINLSDAGDLSRSKNVSVYTIAPKISENKFLEDMKSVADKTGGKFFQEGKGETISNIVNGIESKEKSLLEGNKKTVSKDYPEALFVVVFFSFVGIIIIDKVVLS